MKESKEPDSQFGSTSSDIKPEDLYRRAWRIVQYYYFDQTYNNQNWDDWKHRYDGKLKSRNDAHKAIETMIASLADPYSGFLESYKLKSAEEEKDFCGVGLQIGMNKDKKVEVLSAITNGEAIKARISPGWIVTEVDKKSIEGLPLVEVIEKVKGEAGTKVSLTFNNDGKTKTVSMTRTIIPTRNISKTKILQSGIGYIRIENIGVDSKDEMIDAIKKVKSTNSLIIDLRSNLGGRKVGEGKARVYDPLNSSVKIAQLFIPDGNPILSTIDSDGYKHTSHSIGEPLYNGKIVVLVNHSTSKYAEALAGALKDGARATLIGERTFGDSSIQILSALGDGTAMYLTIGRFVLQSDDIVENGGIEPDIIVTVSQRQAADGRGPWWLNSAAKSNEIPKDIDDIQLKRAIEYLTSGFH